MIADNVLWNGKVIIDQCKEDRVTKAILEFNSLITNDKNSENILLPLRDGLMLIRKL